MLLPDPDGPTKNEQAPGGTSKETPRSASISSSPLRNDLRTSETQIMQVSAGADAVGEAGFRRLHCGWHPWGSCGKRARPGTSRPGSRSRSP